MSYHIISILLENETGALSRLVGLFSARGYNIESLVVAPTENDSLSRLVLTTKGSDTVIEQIVKQLNKLADIVKVIDMTHSKHIEREALLIKLDAQLPSNRDEILRLVDIFRGQIIDVSQQIYIVQLLGTKEKIAAFIQAVDEGLIIEIVRTGPLGIQRGRKALTL